MRRWRFRRCLGTRSVILSSTVSLPGLVSQAVATREVIPTTQDHVPVRLLGFETAAIFGAAPVSAFPASSEAPSAPRHSPVTPISPHEPGFFDFLRVLSRHRRPVVGIAGVAPVPSFGLRCLLIFPLPGSKPMSSPDFYAAVMDRRSSLEHIPRTPVRVPPVTGREADPAWILGIEEIHPSRAAGVRPRTPARRAGPVSSGDVPGPEPEQRWRPI